MGANVISAVITHFLCSQVLDEGVDNRVRPAVDVGDAVAVGDNGAGIGHSSTCSIGLLTRWTISGR